MKKPIGVLGVLVLVGQFGRAVAADGPPTVPPPAATQPTTQPTTQPADPEAVSELVDQLNHPEFKVRDAATRRLIELGELDEAVRPMLEARLAAPEPNPEIAHRIREVLKAIGRRTVKLGDRVSMEFVRIPPGKFTMGSPADEEGRFDDEGPQREVTITRPFHMGICEVTQEQWEAVMGGNPSHFKGATRPVEQVSWDDAVEFCKKASEKTGRTFRLPTEAEWAYACRAGSKTRFSFGDDDKGLDDFGWHSGNSEGTQHPVGQKRPNAFGLHDMHGNLWEWCSDWYAESYANAGVVDPTGPATGWARVVRGGCWRRNPRLCRSSLRFRLEPDYRGSVIGFRVVVDFQ